MRLSEAELDELIRDLADDLCNSDEQITRLIADTNASGWGMDEYETPTITDACPTTTIVGVRLSLSGDHNDDKPFLGDTIDVVVKMIMEKAGEGWVLESYSVEHISLNDDDEIEDDIDDEDDVEI